MRVLYRVVGGFAYFPGLSQPRIFTSEQLSDDQVEHLKDLIRAADFFELPPEVPPERLPARGADRQQIVITIEDLAREHTVHFSDAEEFPEAEALIEYIQEILEELFE